MWCAAMIQMRQVTLPSRQPQAASIAENTHPANTIHNNVQHLFLQRRGANSQQPRRFLVE